jgi:hypothetical protein
MALPELSYHSPVIQDGRFETGNAGKRQKIDFSNLLHWNETSISIINIMKYGYLVTVKRLHGDTRICKSKMATI